MTLNKWCYWPSDDIGNVCMGPVVARSTVEPELLLCQSHAALTSYTQHVCECSCGCLHTAPSYDLCWPCAMDIKDNGAVVHLDKQEHIRSVIHADG